MLPLPADLACPDSTPVPNVHVEVVSTGSVASRWELAVDTGRRGPLAMPVLVGVIDHPQGTVLVDTGLGLATRAGTYPGWPLTVFHTEVPDGAAMVERLQEPPRLILTTHLHYDHVSGLLDLPRTEVWVDAKEWATYGPGAPGFPARRFKRLHDWHQVDLDGQGPAQVLGRPAVDVLGDGTIWYLSTPGHTPGSAAVLVRADDGPWLFGGDTAWLVQHLEDARRPLRTRMAVDAQPRSVEENLEWLRWLHHDCPDLRVVPGHEPTWAEAR